MKIVSIIPGDKPLGAIDWRINIDFINQLDNYADEFRQIAAYDRDHVITSAEDIYKTFKPDAILLLAHSKTLDSYLKNIPCLKVMIAVDYYKIIRDNRYDWYKNNNFDLVVQRGVYDLKHFNEHIGMPSVWLPFSADEKEFKIFNSDRKNMIGFIGTLAGEGKYVQRKKAIGNLEDHGLIDNLGRVGKNNYSEYLSSYIAMLTDTAITNTNIRSPHAKMFEMMASDTVCLSPDFDHNFIPKDCYVEYKDDCSDVVERAKWILTHPDTCDIIRNNAYKEFLDKHTDKIRIKELYDHMDNLLKGKELEKKWMI